MASSAAGDVCGAEPGPMPTIDSTPFESPMMRLLHVSTMDRPRASRTGSARRQTSSIVRRRPRCTSASRRAASARPAARSAAGSATPRVPTKPFHRLRGVLDPGRPVELLGGERAQRPPAPLGEREQRRLVGLLVDRRELDFTDFAESPCARAARRRRARPAPERSRRDRTRGRRRGSSGGRRPRSRSAPVGRGEIAIGRDEQHLPRRRIDAVERRRVAHSRREEGRSAGHHAGSPVSCTKSTGAALTTAAHPRVTLRSGSSSVQPRSRARMSTVSVPMASDAVVTTGARRGWRRRAR
jgi:hypothetical protein